MNGSWNVSWKRPPPILALELNGAGGPKGAGKNGKGGGGRNGSAKVWGGPNRKGSRRGLGWPKNELKSSNGSVKVKTLEWNG